MCAEPAATRMWDGLRNGFAKSFLIEGIVFSAAVPVSAAKLPNMKRYPTLAIVLLLLACTTVHAAAPAPEPSRQKSRQKAMQKKIAELLAAPGVSRVHWGISVTTLDGKPIYALNDGQFFQPASNTKLISTSAAFALIGPDYTSRTLLAETGTRSADGVLHGSLRLIGSGDPSLNNMTWPFVETPADVPSPRLETMPEAFNELARTAAKSGLTAVDGPIIADDSYFPREPYPHGWSWDDLPYYFAVPVDAFNVNDNYVYLNLVAGANAGDPVQASWVLPMPQFKLDTRGVTTGAADSKLSLSVEHFNGNPMVRVYGNIPAGWHDRFGDSTEHVPVAVDDPAEFAGELLRSALAANGIRVSGETTVRHTENNDATSFEKLTQQPITLRSQADALASLAPQLAPGERLLATHTAPPLWQDIQYTAKVSQNQHAEILMHLLGRAYGADGSGAEGIRVERKFLANAGVDTDDVVLYDGSGLSNNDMLTPRALTTLLRYIAAQSWGLRYRASLGIGGVDGTLRSRFSKPPLKGNVVAKTGTLSEARALSGYLTCASGKTIVFSIMADMHTPVGTADREAMDAVVAAIAAAN